MKKILSVLAAGAMILMFAGCGANTPAESTTPTSADETVADTSAAETSAENTTAASTEAEASANDGSVMSYADYAAAPLESAVTVETYVQAKQSWWDNKATVYTQDEDGAYFLYNMACSEDDYAKLTKGTKIRVSGYKAEWSGEVEITDATFEIIDGSFVAEPEDVTALLGKDELIEKQNRFVSFTGMTVEAKQDVDGNNVAFLYNWDGSGEEGSDLYFNVSKNGKTFTFTVESYLCDKDSDVYKAVKALNIGDVIDMEGFLYWYEGVNPHITSVKPSESSGAMTYAQYAEAELDTPVTVETYVQAKQSWWDNKATVYTQDEDGAYFLYNMACSEEDYEKLTEGTKIRVSGYKSEWSGEVEITDATFEIIDGNFVAKPEDVTALLGKEELIEKQNKFVSFKGMTVEAKQDVDGNDVAFLYNWDGSGEEGNDLYFNVSVDGNTYTFTVESYLCDKDTDVYKAVQSLNIGDVVDMEGFLYWYEGVNPHITSVTVVK